MRLYFAAAFGNNWEAVRSHQGARNILLTYANPPEWEKAIVELPKVPGRFNLMVDSGAFSIWNRKSRKDLPTAKTWLAWVKDYVKAVERYCQEVVVVAFDTLPGSAGVMPSPQEARQSAERSYADWQDARAAGVNCIPVFHQHEPFDVLERYLEHTNYLGLSPANDATSKDRVNWLVNVALPRLRESPRTKIHLFGFTSPNGLSAVPVYSADSSAVYNFTKYKVRPRAVLVDTPGDGHTTRFFESRDYTWHWDNARGVQDAIEMFLTLERDVTRLWGRRGVVWPLQDEEEGMQVAPDRLREAPWHCFRLDAMRYVALVKSLERHGCYLPLVVRELSDGALELIDGHVRTQIAKQIPLSTLPVVNLGKISDEEALERHLVLNSIKGEVDAVPYAEALVKLVEARNYGEALTLTLTARHVKDLEAMKAFLALPHRFVDSKRDLEQGDLLSHKEDRMGETIQEAGSAKAPSEIGRAEEIPAVPMPSSESVSVTVQAPGKLPYYCTHCQKDADHQYVDCPHRPRLSVQVQEGYEPEPEPVTVSLEGQKDFDNPGRD